MKPKHILVGIVSVALIAGVALAQDAPTGIQTGPATIAPHWTKNTGYPTSIPEATAYYIVVRGDTLWDIAARYLKNPYLWPQIWDSNKYITDAHWIYPGDPVILPKLAVVAEQAGLPGAGAGAEAEMTAEEAAEAARRAAGVGTGEADQLVAVTEELTLQCASYIVDGGEDEGFKIMGSELGHEKVALAVRDIVYLNRGSSSGVKAGDVYTVLRRDGTVPHPTRRGSVGTKVTPTGWLRVILVQDQVSTAVLEYSCDAVMLGEYLKPFEKVNVPLIVRRPAADRLTPPSGKLTRSIVDFHGNVISAGAGQLVTIDAGADDGVTPGSVFSVYRIVYPSVPTPRRVVGEATVVAVRPRTATAKLTYTEADIQLGDVVELR